ncbi:hypothetical protein [Paenisporosarcina sp. OV554]|uniref:hypothetical protein n=1 Tax=Paenisporosarcina sp. OV554 TaxID=2135694 RepID=UPI000D395F27|nr:hypothetical protein [Paenisporosarcina sp. OV554]PUB12643.1 hypothetical protein C8K15_109142 [Paenisporosarcina sp. OV554]
MDLLTIVLFLIIFIVGYISFKMGKTSEAFKILDTLIDEFEYKNGFSVDLEKNVKVYEDLLQGELDFYSGNQDRMDENEKNKYLNRIRESSDELSSAKMELQKKIEEDPIAFREEKLVRDTKKGLLRKMVRAADVGQEEGKDYMTRIK